MPPKPWFIESSSGPQVTTFPSGIISYAQAAGQYSDMGSDEEMDILAFLADHPWRDSLRIRLRDRPWLRDIITDQRRPAAVLKVPLPAGARILDVGSGWGQLAIPLAKLGHEVVCLDQTPARLLLLQAIAKQEKVTPHLLLGNIESAPLGPASFDLVILNGALEWTIRDRQADADPSSHQAAVLRRCAGLLRPGGKVFLAIENALGLKYIMGSRDDHCGLPWVTLAADVTAERMWRAAGADGLRARTHDLTGYRHLFGQSGLCEQAAWGCYPDYKLPIHIVPVNEINDFILQADPWLEHHGDDGRPLPDEWPMMDTYRRLAHNGVAHFMAPSYAFLLGRSEEYSIEQPRMTNTSQHRLDGER